MDSLGNTVALPVWVVALFIVGVIGAIGHLYIKSYELDKKQAVSDNDSDNIMKELQEVNKKIDGNQKDTKEMFERLSSKIDLFLADEIRYLKSLPFKS